MEILQDTTPQPELNDDMIQFMINSRSSNLREQRNKLLNETDKYMLPDFPITSNNLELMKTYRQELRNYMELPNINTSNIPFPIFPF